VSKPRWITPAAAPTSTQQIVIEVPNVPEYVALLRAVFGEIADPENWEQVYGIGVVEAAEWAQEIAESFEANL